MEYTSDFVRALPAAGAFAEAFAAGFFVVFFAMGSSVSVARLEHATSVHRGFQGIFTPFRIIAQARTAKFR
jgi:hypothetical protein